MMLGLQSLSTRDWIIIALLIITVALVAFNIFATFELADEAADLKEALLAA